MAETCVIITRVDTVSPAEVSAGQPVVIAVDVAYKPRPAPDLYPSPNLVPGT